MQIEGKDFMDWLHEQRKKEKALFFQKPDTYLKEMESSASDLLAKYHLVLPTEKAPSVR